MRDENTRLRFKNKSATSIAFVVEPWAEEFEVPSNSVILVYLIDRESEPIDFWVGDGIISVWINGKSKIFIDSKDVTPNFLI
jgi:hypothetical protein